MRKVRARNLFALVMMPLCTGCMLFNPPPPPSLPAIVQEVNRIPPEKLSKEQLVILLDWSRSGCLRLADAYADLGEVSTAAGLMKECRRAAAPENLKALRRRLLEFYPQWSEADRKRISEGTPFVGMTAEQLVACLGEPREKNKKPAGQEQWVYVAGKVVVMLKKDKVATIQSPFK